MGNATKAPKAPTMFAIEPGTRQSRCSGSMRGGTCSAPVYWITDEFGRRRIIDADVPGGKRPSESKDLGQFDMLSGGEAPVYAGCGVDHHLTCPDVALFSKKER